MAEKIGVIGVGLMGHGIAANIVKKGWPLHYLDHPGNQPTTDLDQLGAQKWPSAAKMAAACDVVLLCVTGTPQVQDVLVGAGGVLEALRPGAVIVDCSTAIPDSTRKLAAKVTARGAFFIDAAMTRTPREAEAGRLNLLVGGEADVIERVRPLLAAVAENIFLAGGVGAGHELKLLHNFVSLGTLTLIAEAIACAGRSGVEQAALMDCLQRGGGAGVALDRLAPYVKERKTDQLRFSIGNALKDLTYYNEMASSMGASQKVAAGVKATLELLVQQGHGEAFVPQEIDLLA